MTKILSIDTSKSKSITVGISIDGKSNFISSQAKNIKSEATLPLIDILLKKENLDIEDIDGVEVNLDKGSFTGLRVGASIANALSFLLKVKINNKKIGELARPVYNDSRYD